MDLFNNQVGALTGSQNRMLSKDSLIAELIRMIYGGKMKIILKSANGNFLDCNGKLLKPEDYERKWNNSRCLVNSNESSRH
jgi:hypothetical protein